MSGLKDRWRVPPELVAKCTTVMDAGGVRVRLLHKGMGIVGLEETEVTLFCCHGLEAARVEEHVARTAIIFPSRRFEMHRIQPRVYHDKPRTPFATASPN